MDLSPAGTGHRCYEVRRALGPDPRHEMPQRAFAQLLNAKAEEMLPPFDRPRYDSSVIARIEKGDRRATVIDVTLMAAVDPLRRGVVWLALDERADPTLHVGSLQSQSGTAGGPGADYTVGAVMLTPAQIARAEEAVAAKEANGRAAAKSVRPKRRPSSGGR